MKKESANDNKHKMFVENLRNMNIYSSTTTNSNKQHIVISDLHGDITRWNLVKNKINSNPNMRVTILGDATDRGKYGIQILLEIKELSDMGKVEYLPGNHDIFLYDYVMMANAKSNKLINIKKQAMENLLANGGKTTKQSLKEFDMISNIEFINGDIKKIITLDELINWLGRQRIQKKVVEHGRKYALAHAFFDDELYSYDSEYTLEKALEQKMSDDDNEVLLNKFETVMWYREEDKETQTANVMFPKGHIMIVGHTRQKEVNIRNLENNPEQPIMYIDTGKGPFAGYDLTNDRVINFMEKEPKSIEWEEFK